MLCASIPLHHNLSLGFARLLLYLYSYVRTRTLSCGAQATQLDQHVAIYVQTPEQYQIGTSIDLIITCSLLGRLSVGWPPTCKVGVS